MRLYGPMGFGFGFPARLVVLVFNGVLVLADHIRSAERVPAAFVMLFDPQL